MSHYYYNTLLAYEPVHSEYSYQVNDHPLTEPFWQQYPIWAQPEQLQHISIHPKNNYYKFAMDEQPLVIGYNTKNGKRLSAGQKSSKAKSPDKPRAKGKVDVYVGVVFLQKVLFSHLLRFSTTAQKAFPRPPKKAEKDESQPVKRDWADDDEEGIDAEKLSLDVAKLSLGTQSDNSAIVSKKKTLDVGLSTLWIQPPAEAFKFAFNWMYEAARGPQDQQLLVFGVPNPDNLSLEKLIDLYAAGLCLGLRPRPVKHLTDIFERISKNPPTLEEIVYIHEHLPVNDSVMTRAINSFLTYKSATSEVYTKAERDAIEKYFHEVDGDLYNRFTDINNYRQEQRRTRLRDQGALRLQKLAEGSEPFIDEGGVRYPDSRAGESKSPAAEGGGQRRARGGGKNQQARGKKGSEKGRVAS